MKFDANGKKTEERKTDLLRSRSRSGSLRSISDTSATTSEIFIRSSTASSRSLMASGLHRGEHSHCFSNLLPVSRARSQLLPDNMAKYLYIQQSTICTHGHLLPVHTAKYLYTQSITCTHGKTHVHTTIYYLYTWPPITCTHGKIHVHTTIYYLYTRPPITCTHGKIPVHTIYYLYTR